MSAPSELDTVSTCDGFIDGGMLLMGLDTAAVERSRVNFPEDSGTSVHRDKHEIHVAKLDSRRRFLTRDVLPAAKFVFELEMKAGRAEGQRCAMTLDLRRTAVRRGIAAHNDFRFSWENGDSSDAAGANGYAAIPP